jgi:hypothetical protein
MKSILVAMVNYGTDQLSYLQKVIDTVRSFEKYKATIIVNSNVPLDGVQGIDKVNVIELYSGPFNFRQLLFKMKFRSRWDGSLYTYKLLPMTCRRVIDQESENFDYFLFTENDHLWLEHHIDKFIEYESILPENRISGLIQYEQDDTGIYFPAYHDDYDWDYTSVEEHGGKKFAHFTNLNQSSFLISKRQLKKIKKQYDFTQFFARDHYRLIPKTNTDLYQYCGMKKVICISEFEYNIIHHLPNIYINGILGRRQLRSDQTRMADALKGLLQVSEVNFFEKLKEIQNSPQSHTRVQ